MTNSGNLSRPTRPRRVWLVTVGEPLPTDPGTPRLLRCGLLARTLADQGEEVVWWTSTFDHFRKAQRHPQDAVAEIAPNYQIRLLHAPGYARNISVSRILNHVLVARKFTRAAPRAARPDIILCSFPTIELCAAAVDFGRCSGVPVVLDIRDQWPDIFLELVPQWMRPATRIALAPMFRDARRACAGASALTGHAPSFVKWGLQLAGRSAGLLDRDFPFGYSVETPSENSLESARKFWARFGLEARKDGLVVCFFGTLGRQFDLDTVIRAARRLETAGRNIRFVICGAGDFLEHYRAAAAGLRTMVFPGWVGHPEIWTLMQVADLGIAPYWSTSSFVESLPNKSIEYLSAGLPIISSLRGYLQELLETHRCGVTYPNGDDARLAELLIALQDDPDHRRQMAVNARAVFERQFNANAVYGEMADYLRRIAAAHSMNPGQ